MGPNVGSLLSSPSWASSCPPWVSSFLFGLEVLLVLGLLGVLSVNVGLGVVLLVLGLLGALGVNVAGVTLRLVLLVLGLLSVLGVNVAALAFGLGTHAVVLVGTVISAQSPWSGEIEVGKGVVPGDA